MNDKCEQTLNVPIDDIDSLIRAWGYYTAYLQQKYPATDSKQWVFTCPHHRAIDNAIWMINLHRARQKAAE